MEIQKKFSFLGNLRKLHEQDNQPIENFIANILCFHNGNIFIDIDSGINEIFSHKFFYDSAEIKSKNSLEIIENKNLYRLLFCQTDELEEELIQTPYEGDYIIEGITAEGWAIKANIANANFSISTQDFAGNTQNSLVRLSDLYIDYNPEYIKGKTIESIYGIFNLEILYNFSTIFLDSKCEFSLVSTSRGNNEAEILSAEMIFIIIDKNNTEEISFNTYFAWFELLISFATGKCIKEIYRIETTQSSSGKKKIEFWSGSQVFIKGGGVAVIQQAYLHLFIQQCASKVTWVTFSDKGLGLALHWYVEAFTTNTVSVEFILLCTVLETLNQKHLSVFSSKLIPTSIYRKIRKQILSILSEYQKEFDDEDTVGKYHIFRAKVEKSFEDASLNKVGSLRTSLKQMLEFYKVPYEDLFPELEFIKIRDNIVHAGFGGLDIAPEVRKLANLIVRLILSILEYQGNYIESIRIEIEDKMGRSKHGLTYKTFPFQNEC